MRTTQTPNDPKKDPLKVPSSEPIRVFQRSDLGMTSKTARWNSPFQCPFPCSEKICLAKFQTMVPRTGTVSLISFFRVSFCFAFFLENLATFFLGMSTVYYFPSTFIFFRTPMSYFSLWNVFCHSTNHLRLRQAWRTKHSHIYSIEGHEKGGGWEQCGELQAGQWGTNCRCFYEILPDPWDLFFLGGDHYWEEWYGSRSDFAAPELASLVLSNHWWRSFWGLWVEEDFFKKMMNYMGVSKN